MGFNIRSYRRSNTKRCAVTRKEYAKANVNYATMSVYDGIQFVVVGEYHGLGVACYQVLCLDNFASS